MGTHSSHADLQGLITLPGDITRTRRCFLLRVRPEKLEEYVKVHQRVWSDMLHALHETGWRNYSLFLNPKDGLVVGYFEAKDTDVTERLMNEHPANARWQAEMAQYFVEDCEHQPLIQYFHLT